MKKIILCCSISLIIGLSGCIVKSFHALYSEDKVVLDDRLIGTWRNIGKGPYEIIRFERRPIKVINSKKILNIISNLPKDGKDTCFHFDAADSTLYENILRQNAYFVTIIDSSTSTLQKKFPDGSKSDITKKTTVNEYTYEIHIVKLGNNRYFDIYPLDLKESFDQFEQSSFKTHSFAKFKIEDNQLAIDFFDDKYIAKLFMENKIRIAHEKNEDEILLTASTEELQKFVTKYGDREEAYDAKKAWKLKKMN